MKNGSQLLFLFLFVLLALSACKDDEEPAPMPQSYLEYAGRIYELHTALYISHNPPNEERLLIEFYSMEMEELNAIMNPESGQFLEGHILSMGLSSPVVGEIGEGSYTYFIHNFAEFNIFNADIMIGYNALKEAGIFLYPVAGTVNFQKQEIGYLVSFDFTLSNEDRVTGRFQGELIKKN